MDPTGYVLASGSQSRGRLLGPRSALAPRRCLCAHRSWKVGFLNGDGDLLLIAVYLGDTVASTLVSLFFPPRRGPTQIEKLSSELEDIDSPFATHALAAKTHLNGVINEALRLHPALPSGGLRQTPVEGLIVAGRYLPGDTVISAPRYCLGRRTFNPSRFSSDI